MNTVRHGLKRTTRRTASAIPSAVLSEPKLTKAEKLEVERAWKIEVRRRMADFRAGKVKCVPAEQAMRNAYRAIDTVRCKKN
jgi:transcription initiation factor TFIID subunit TAF12